MVVAYRRTYCQLLPKDQPNSSHDQYAEKVPEVEKASDVSEPNPSSQDDDKKNGLDGGVVALIVMAALVGCGVSVAAVAMYIRKCKYVSITLVAIDHIFVCNYCLFW